MPHFLKVGLRLVEAKKGRKRESREIGAVHGQMERRGGNAERRGARGQEAPFIVGQAYLAIAR